MILYRLFTSIITYFYQYYFTQHTGFLAFDGWLKKSQITWPARTLNRPARVGMAGRRESVIIGVLPGVESGMYVTGCCSARVIQVKHAGRARHQKNNTRNLFTSLS